MRIGIFYHSDPAGRVPSGIDSFIRGVMQWAPEGLEYTLYGASSDLRERPLHVATTVQLGGRACAFVPMADISASAGRRMVPDTVRYMRGLSYWARSGHLQSLDVLDFHRIEPLWLFRHDRRPRNLVLHQDMSVLREPGCDIKWRHAPWAYEFFERRSFGLVENINVVRESAVLRYRKLYPGIAGKFHFVPTWYDPVVFGWSADTAARSMGRQELCARYRIDPGARILVFVGRFDRQKDPMLLLEAVAGIVAAGRSVHLLMIGDGTLRPAIEGCIAQGPLRGRVTLTGAMDRAAIAGTLKAADLFVLSSAYEGMPIAVLEALACGLPVVATDVGELGRVIRNGVNGELVEAGSARALAGGIVAALDKSPSMAGAPCHDSVADFRPQNVLGAIYDLHRRQASVGRGPL